MIMSKNESEKTILIIGNGFDIAHGLPTQYTDFMDFIDVTSYKFSKAYQIAATNSGGLSEDYCNKVRDTVLITLGNDNQLLKFIKRQLESQRGMGENWVDFEQEIANVVKLAEKKFYDNRKNNNLDNLWNFDFDIDFSNVPTDSDKLHEDFYRLKCAFEYYVAEIVDKIVLTSYSKDIQNIKPDMIISLNYSDTYERQYSRFNEIDYIHGKALIMNSEHLTTHSFCPPEDISDDKKIEFYRDINHIVLGMDEYYPENELSDHTQFIQFRKYFQRISKRTGSKYRKLLTAEKLNVYVFGHSLDPTDAVILKDTIGHNNSRTTIFYHDENSHIRGITNLIKVFGNSFVVDKCDGNDPQISFVKQKDMTDIDDGGHFYLMKGLEYLKHIKEISGNEFDRNYYRVIDGLNNGRGIETQNDVLIAFSTLYNLGLLEQFQTQLLNAIKDKPVRDSAGDLVNAIWLDPEWWAEPTVDQRLEVPKEKRDFINSINEINRNKLGREGKQLVIDNNNYIHEYEKEIPVEISQNEYRAFLTRMIGALKNSNETKRIWKLLEAVTVSKGNVGAQIELKAMEKEKDEYKQIVAKVLLKYLEEYLEWKGALL